jgi:hypothetical protein
VVVEVEVGVVLPRGAGEAEGDETQLLAKARDEVQPRGDVIAKLLVARLRPLEDRGAGDVHVRAAALEVQERVVES